MVERWEDGDALTMRGGGCLWGCKVACNSCKGGSFGLWDLVSLKDSGWRMMIADDLLRFAWE